MAQCILPMTLNDWNGTLSAETVNQSKWVAVATSLVPEDMLTYIVPKLDSLPGHVDRVYFSCASFIEGPYQVPILNSRYLPEIVFVRSSVLRPETLSNLKTWESLVDGALKLTFSVQEAFTFLCRYSDYYVQAGCLITDYCNLNCKMCMFHSQANEYEFASLRLAKRGKQKISHSDMFSFLDQIPASRRILFSASGEIFTCKSETLQYFEHAKKKNLEVGFISNGGLLDEQTSQQVLEIGITDAIFSVDGHNADVYNEIRKGGNFDLTVNNIKKYIQLVRKNKKPAKVAINTILFKNFELQKDGIVNFWKSVGVDRHNFLVERLDYFGKPRSLLVQFNDDLRNYCFDPLQGPILLANGKIAPCCSVAIGEYFESMDWLCSIKNVSLKDAVKNYRQMLLDFQSPFKQYCRKCHYWSANYTLNGKNPFSQTTDFVVAEQKRFFRRLWK